MKVPFLYDDVIFMPLFLAWPGCTEWHTLSPEEVSGVAEDVEVSYCRTWDALRKNHTAPSSNFGEEVLDGVH